MKQYLEILQHVLDNGEERQDRTGVGTLSIFGAQARYDLRNGFPLVTTKKVFWKGVVEELLWFLRGETNVRSLQEKGVHIWDAWRRPYSLDRKLVFIEPIKKQYVPYSGGFSRNGINAPAGSLEFQLADTWRRMMRRCYDPTHHRYEFYGAKGTSVCERWHDPRNFIEDAQKLPHWYYKQRDWSRFDIDKDYFGANQYGPDTSVWLREDENTTYATSTLPLAVASIDGAEYQFISSAAAARHLGISTSSMCRFVGAGPLARLKGANKKFIGWVFEPLDLGGKLARLELIPEGDLGPVYGAQWRRWKGADGRSFDQIANVIQSIKDNPHSRRHLVSAWNVADLDDMALPPCHFAFQFYVSNKKELSCQLYQRSGDAFIGIPFNIASYALLTHMIAQVCDLGVGELIHTIGDLHLYLNHIDQAKEQLGREPLPLPTLRLNKAIMDIDDFTSEDIELINYNPHPTIKAPVAV